MPLPATWKTITVTATFTRADTAGPAAGSVQFTPVKAVGIAADVVLPALITAILNGSGQISVSLPCPNSAGVTSLVYEVIERVPGGRSYYIEVLASMAGSIALADFTIVEPADAQQAWALSAQGYANAAGESANAASASQMAAETAAAGVYATLGGLGYLAPVAYASSISMTMPSQTVEYGGDIYAPNSDDLPFTTSGTFESAKFRLIVPGQFAQAGAGALIRPMLEKAREFVTDADFDTPAHAVAAAAGKDAIYNILGGDSGSKYKAIACVIRQDSIGSGWYLINDTGHKPVGVSSVAADAGGTLTISFNFTASRIGALNITPDEGFAAAGLDVGASVGLSNATLTFYAPFEARLSNLAVAWGNFITTTGGFFSCDTSTAMTDGKVVFTHPPIVHADSGGPAVTVNKYMQAVLNGNSEIVVTAISKTGFTLQAMEPIAAKVVTNGSGAVTVTSELVTPPTTSWNVANNRMVITHATSTAANGFSVTPMTSNYKLIVEAYSATTLEVAFYDSSNTKYTGAAPPASVSFVFTRPGNAEGVWYAGNRVIVRRGGKCKVRAQDVFGTNDNWWVLGVHRID